MASDDPMGVDDALYLSKGVLQATDAVDEPRNPVFVSYRTKIIEILKNLHSPEIKIYSDASKEFIGLLRGDLGGQILKEYVQLSPKCSEIVEAWRIHQGKPGLAHVLLLVAQILEQPNWKSNNDGIGISRNLDGLARFIIEKKMDDIYGEIKSGESRRQSAALYLLASVVRRGSGLAAEVAKTFDFKLGDLSKLSGLQKKRMKGRQTTKRSTRRAFVEFAMSFLEVGTPRLLRWILQQRDMYSSVLREIGSDDSKTVIYVLSTLKDKVLTEDSLLPPSLRSVLFGSVTLEQLVCISGNTMACDAAEMAYKVLHVVCTEPCNGLMPDLKRRGNEKRLTDLMKKLKATEVDFHRVLLLDICKKRSHLAAVYMDEFPYHLEPRPTFSWFSAISLAADVIASLNADAAIYSLHHSDHSLTIFDSAELHNIFRSIIPRSCNRTLVNKGLLHVDIMVKHGSLRLVFELLRSLERLFKVIDNAIDSLSTTTVTTCNNFVLGLHGLPGVSFISKIDNYLSDAYCNVAEKSQNQNWATFKQYVQDEVRAILPDPQVLLKLLSSLSQGNSEKSSSNLHKIGRKRLKSDIITKDIDIVISGIDTGSTHDDPIVDGKINDGHNCQEMDTDSDDMDILAKIWSDQTKTIITSNSLDAWGLFHCKLLDVITIYMRMIPDAFEGSFDFFRILPSNPLILPINQQMSLLNLLLEYIGGSPALPVSMYKYLQPFANLFIYSEDKGIKDQAFALARASLLSTGAFEHNVSEVDAWLICLPSYKANLSAETQGIGTLYGSVISFLCDAVSTVGNNLYKHLDHIHKFASNLSDFEDEGPGFSPLVTCVLQKCIRLLEANSQTFKLCNRTLVSLYVHNVLCLILQSQVDMKILSGFIDMVLNDKFHEDSKSSLCEWRPLKNLLYFAQNILNSQEFLFFSSLDNTFRCHNSFGQIYTSIKDLVSVAAVGSQSEIALAFASSLICSSPSDVVENFHLILEISLRFKFYISFFSYVLLSEPMLLSDVASLLPDIFLPGPENFKDNASTNYSMENVSSLGRHDFPYSTGISPSSSDSLASGESVGTLSLFIQNASFCSVFSAIVCLGSSRRHSKKTFDLLHSPILLELMRSKLKEFSISEMVLLFRYLLFWAYKILLSYYSRPSDALEKLFQTSFAFIDYLWDCILECHTGAKSTMKIHSSLDQVQCVVDLIVCHPIMSLLISQPMCSKDHGHENLDDKVDDIVGYSKEMFHPMNQLCLLFLIKVIKKISQEREGMCSFEVHYNRNTIKELNLEAPRQLLQKIVLVFREKFGICAEQGDFGPLLPYLYSLHSMVQLVSPFYLLEVVDWMFSKLYAIGVGDALARSAQKMCISLADGAFTMLHRYLKFNHVRQSECNLLWGTNDIHFDSSVLQRVYHAIIESTISNTIEGADICLLKAVEIAYSPKYVKVDKLYLPVYMLFSGMVINSPVKLLLKCFHHTNKTKAKILFLLVEVSQLHRNIFGQIFLAIIHKSLHSLDALNAIDACTHWGVMPDTCLDSCFSEDSLVLLLPAALSYFTSNLSKNKQVDNTDGSIPIFYSSILLKNFSNWKSYISGMIFAEEHFEYLYAPDSVDILEKCRNGSLIGKAITMLQFFFALHGSSVTKQQRLKSFNSLYPCSLELVDDDISMLSGYSYDESLKLINEVAAKISFTMLLISSSEISLPVQDLEILGVSQNMNLKKASKSLNSAKLRFITILVNTLDQIFKIFPEKVDNQCNRCTNCKFCVCRSLEFFILENIINLSKEARSSFSQFKTVPFIRNFLESCLLYRCKDPVTLSAIRCFLVALPEGKFSSTEVIKLVLELFHECVADLSTLSPVGTLLQPIPSVLKYLDLCHSDEEVTEVRSMQDDIEGERKLALAKQKMKLIEQKMELVKLLRVLYHYRRREKELGFEICHDDYGKRLIYLLLAAYGATVSKNDLEILHLMLEIETIDGSEYAMISEMDYLWGSSVLKVRNDFSLFGASLNMEPDGISSQQDHKMLFRENIPVDSKLCAKSLLKICSDQSMESNQLSLENLLESKFTDRTEQQINSSTSDVHGYDPTFVLRFAIHSLVMGFIEPSEFTRLGLLAMTFVSISSSDQNLRKLGYEALGRFKLVLEDCPKNKDLLKLQLLLTWLQNGISEPWEKIPSVIAVFVAEASFILLDSVQNQFFMISKFLMDSHKMNIKAIPLFNTFFESNSVNLKLEQQWMLRLLFAGINSHDDAKIYRRNKTLEALLSFYFSSLSDSDSRLIILQIVKKSVKQPMLAEHLMKDCGLFSWLFSILSTHPEHLHFNQNESSLMVITLVLKVIRDVLSIKSLIGWQQDCALEELSRISSYLLTIQVDDAKNGSLIDLILYIFASTVNLSMKRKIYQPHFTISLQGLIHLYQAIDTDLRGTSTSQLALTAILMTFPFPIFSGMESARMVKLVTWALSDALRLHNQRSLAKESCYDMLVSYQDLQTEPLLAKLLRWLTASVIMGRISNAKSKFCLNRKNFESLKSLLEFFEENTSGEENLEKNEALAVIIIYIQLLLQRNCIILSSVISALCLLLLSNSLKIMGKDHLNREQILSLCSKIRCPPETNPAWRWSFYQPCRDFELEQTEIEQIEELQACQRLLLLFSNVLVGEKSCFVAFSDLNLVQSTLFKLELEKNTRNNS